MTGDRTTGVLDRGSQGRVAGEPRRRLGWVARLTIRLAIAATVLAAFPAGCGRLAVEPEGGRARWIAEVPSEFLTDDSLLSARVVLDWQLGQPSAGAQPDFQGWQVTPSDASRKLTPEGLVLASSEPTVGLERELGLAAAEIDAVRVTLRGVRRKLHLQWSRPGEAFAGGGSVVASARDGEEMPTGHRRVTLMPRGDPEWSGVIGGIRVIVPVERGQPVVVARIEVLSYSSSVERLAAAAARPWKVDVDHEVRDARLGLAGLPLSWAARIRGAGTLRFGYALTGRPETGFQFTVSVRESGGADRLLWSDVLDPVHDPQCVNTWHDAQVELRDLRDGEHDLVFAVKTDGPHDPRNGWSVWSSPILVGAAHEGVPPNVVLVSIDTLRADRLSLYGYARNTSPHLDAWAARHAVVFENAVAQSPWTLPSHVSLFTGLNVTRHGVSHTGSTALVRLDTMAGRFRDAGYDTFAVTGGGYVHPRYGFANGFDRYRYWAVDDTPPEHEFRGGVDHAVDQVRGATEPFLLFLHTFAVHGPYRCREPYFGRLSPEREPPDGLVNPTDSGFVLERGDGSEPVSFDDVQLASAMYDSGVAYVDDELHRFLELLRETGVLDRSIVVFTSDHGEGLGEEAVTGHGYLKENNVLVPLAIAFPDRSGAGTRVASQVRLIDILPTLLEATGLPPADDIDGASLRPLIHDETAAHPELAITYAIARKGGVGLRYQNRLKFTFNNSAFEPLRGREALFDLVADPAEIEDRLGASGEDLIYRDELRELLGRHSGLRMQFANPGSQPIEAWIRGPLVHPEGVKSFDLGCPCVSQERKDELHAIVPPGERYTLVFERVTAGAVEVELYSPAAAEGRPFHYRFRPATLGPGLSIRFDRGQWSTANQGPADGEVLTIFWHGDEAVQTVEAPPIVGSSLVDQLRVLGYAE